MCLLELGQQYVYRGSRLCSMNLWEEWVCVRQHARKRTTVIAILLLAVSLSSFAHVTAHSPDSLTLWATPNDPGSKKAWQLPSNLRKVEEFLTATDAALAALATGDQGYWYDLFSNAVIDPYMDNVPQALAAIVYMRWILGVHVVMPGFLVPLSIENYPDPDQPGANWDIWAYGRETASALRIMRSVAAREITDLDGFRRLTAILSELKPQR